MNARTRRFLTLLGAAATALAASGCAIFYGIGAMGESFESQKLIEVLPKYHDLPGHSVAVIVDAPLDVLYGHPDLVQQITAGVTMRLARDVDDIQVVIPGNIVAWQWKTPDWNTMAYGDLAESLNVERVVHIDIYEYRLNPPGNRWLWEGVCAASVSVIERDGFDPDTFAESFEVSGEFPTVTGVDRSGATARQIEVGVLAEFIKRSAWLFHKHLEPKHPDKYKPELDNGETE